MGETDLDMRFKETCFCKSLRKEDLKWGSDTLGKKLYPN
jgi:hypothetical protein